MDIPRAERKTQMSRTLQPFDDPGEERDKKRGKRTLKWRCWTLIEQAPERKQKMTSL